jgi:hypothetical protein
MESFIIHNAIKSRLYLLSIFKKKIFISEEFIAHSDDNESDINDNDNDNDDNYNDNGNSNNNYGNSYDEINDDNNDNNNDDNDKNNNDDQNFYEKCIINMKKPYSIRDKFSLIENYQEWMNDKNENEKNKKNEKNEQIGKNEKNRNFKIELHTYRSKPPTGTISKVYVYCIISYY